MHATMGIHARPQAANKHYKNMSKNISKGMPKLEVILLLHKINLLHLLTVNGQVLKDLHYFQPDPFNFQQQVLPLSQTITAETPITWEVWQSLIEQLNKVNQHNQLLKKAYKKRYNKIMHMLWKQNHAVMMQAWKQIKQDKTKQRVTIQAISVS